MTRQELKSLFESLTGSIPTSANAEIPARNFSSYPETVLEEVTDGVFYGFHYGPELDAFNSSVTTCCYDGEEFSMDEIESKESERGESHLYMMKMYGDEKYKLEKVRGGELRQIAGLCSIKKIK